LVERGGVNRSGFSYTMGGDPPGRRTT